MNVAQTAADLDFRGYNNIFIEELKTDSGFYAEVGFFNFQQVLLVGSAGVGCQVVIKFYSCKRVYPEVAYSIAF